MTGQVHVFAGPSLPARARADYPELHFHGPAAQGEVYRLAQQRPLAIALIDGYFEHVASVWHKELLWAMSRGVHLFGAASMGALRAAELADFGMRGVGRVYEDFASGALTDDDEVALVHADASFDFRAVSDALVNLRATLALAESERVLTTGQRDQLLAQLKLRFYPDRSYATLLSLARQSLPADTVARLDAWLKAPEHRLDQKRADAGQLLARLRAFQASRPESLRVDWTFQHTDAWEQVRRSVVHSEAERACVQPSALGASARVSRARLRALEIESARRDGYVPTPADIAAAAEAFRRQRGLLESEALHDFLSRAGLSPTAFEELMAGEACVRRSRLAPSYDLERALADIERLETSAEPAPSPE